jgi:uncharacterized membrane protein YoaK (UPF0700 family)
MLLALTMVAGSVDAISYLGLGHVFTAMMTGNTVLLGLALAQREFLAAIRSVLALLGFAIGVFIGAAIVERESKPATWPKVVTAALGIEAVILVIFSMIWYATSLPRSAAVTYLLIVLLALAMGIQSAAVRRLGVPGIATTYITGTLTSLMVDLLGWLRALAARLPMDKPHQGSATGKPPVPWEQRVGLLAGVVILYCLGALAGGILQAQASPVATVMPLVILILVVVNALLHQLDYRHASY